MPPLKEDDMRVWIVETTPICEQPTRQGVFASPSLAASTWTEQVNTLASYGARVDFTLNADPSADPAVADIILEADRGGDVVTMSGVWVEGTGNEAPSMADWHALKLTLAGAVRAAAQPRAHDEPRHLQTWVDNADTRGSWTIVRGD